MTGDFQISSVPRLLSGMTHTTKKLRSKIAANVTIFTKMDRSWKTILPKTRAALIVMMKKTIAINRV